MILRESREVERKFLSADEKFGRRFPSFFSSLSIFISLSICWKGEKGGYLEEFGVTTVKRPI